MKVPVGADSTVVPQIATEIKQSLPPSGLSNGYATATESVDAASAKAYSSLAKEAQSVPSEINILPDQDTQYSYINSPGSMKSKKGYLDNFVAIKQNDVPVLSAVSESVNKKDSTSIEDPDWEDIHQGEPEDEEKAMTVSPLMRPSVTKPVQAPIVTDSESEVVHITRASDTSPSLVEATLLAGCYQLDATHALEKHFAGTFNPEIPTTPEIFPLGHTRTFTGSQIIQTSKTSLERMFKESGGRPKVLTCGLYMKPNRPRPPLQITAVAIYSSKKEVFVSITISAAPGEEHNDTLLGSQKIVIFTSDSGLPIIEKTFKLVPYSYGVPNTSAKPSTASRDPSALASAGKQNVYPIVPCAYYSHSGVIWYR
jgi:hypothetical protein